MGRRSGRGAATNADVTHVGAPRPAREGCSRPRRKCRVIKAGGFGRVSLPMGCGASPARAAGATARSDPCDTSEHPDNSPTLACGRRASARRASAPSLRLGPHASVGGGISLIQTMAISAHARLRRPRRARCHRPSLVRQLTEGQAAPTSWRHGVVSGEVGAVAAFHLALERQSIQSLRSQYHFDECIAACGSPAGRPDHSCAAGPDPTTVCS